MNSTKEKPLRGSFGTVSMGLVPAILLLSLACNVTALVVPFMHVDVFLKGDSDYSLPRSVYLMWESGLYVVAVLVLLFSIAFPFAKLAALSAVWLRLFDGAKRRVCLRWVEALGKWSFLDVFVVCIILVLTNDQWFVSARPVMGIYFFMAAITLSMIGGILIERSEHHDDRSGGVGTAGGVRLAVVEGWHRWAIPVLLVMWLVGLGAATVFPFIKVDQLFSGHAYSLADSVRGLFSERAYVMAGVVAGTLIAVPLVQWLVYAGYWFVRARHPEHRSWGRWLNLCGQWAMLDVFGLALLVFLLEGKSLVKTETTTGLYALIGAIALTLVSVGSIKIVARKLTA